MDLAEVVERTREVKRRLASGRLPFSPEEVFREPFMHLPHLVEMRCRLDELIRNGSPEWLEEAIDCRKGLDQIIAAMKADLASPGEEELLRRFSEGRIDARTVLQLTGWSLEEMYDACSRHGLQIT